MSVFLEFPNVHSPPAVISAPSDVLHQKLADRTARVGFRTTGIDLDSGEVLVRSSRLVVDTRNAIKGAHGNVSKLGAPMAMP